MLLIDAHTLKNEQSITFNKKASYIFNADGTRLIIKNNNDNYKVYDFCKPKELLTAGYYYYLGPDSSPSETERKSLRPLPNDIVLLINRHLPKYFSEPTIHNFSLSKNNVHLLFAFLSTGALKLFVS